jgi:hypothetical protein
MDDIKHDHVGATGFVDRVVHFKVSQGAADVCPLPYLPTQIAVSLETPVPSPSVQVAFEISQYSLSGLRVDQLKVLNDTQYKPFRGIRTFAKSGHFEVRW